MPGQTKNIGQVAAIWIAATAPSNTKLVWYDTSSSVHRVYDTALGQWVALNPQVITSASIASLRSIATGSGLPIGKYYTLTDTGTIAIAITSTKIWYVDTHNNYVVNDLAAASQYYINSTNLLIDGSTGVWDTTNGQLKFEFSEISSAANMDAANDYFVMRRKSGNVWSWAKSKLSNFISLVTGNSLTWNKGLYFNFGSAINDIMDRQGGVCSTMQHYQDMENLRQQVNNTSLQNQQYLLQAREYTNQQTAPENIYAKQLPSLLNIPANPSAAPAVGWQLKTILQQIYGWINKLKLGNNINVGSNFNIAGRSGDLNASDSVMHALEKLLYKAKKLATGDNINVGNGFNSAGRDGNVTASDSVMYAIERLVFKTNALRYANGVYLPNAFNPNGVSGDVAASDSVMLAIEKLVFKAKNVYSSSIILHSGTSTTEVTEYPRDPQTGVPSIKYGDSIFDAIRKLMSNISKSMYAGQNIMQTSPGEEVSSSTPVPAYTDYTPIHYGDSVFVSIRKILSTFKKIQGTKRVLYDGAIKSSNVVTQSGNFQLYQKGNKIFLCSPGSHIRIIGNETSVSVDINPVELDPDFAASDVGYYIQVHLGTFGLRGVADNVSDTSQWNYDFDVRGADLELILVLIKNEDSNMWNARLEAAVMDSSDARKVYKNSTNAEINMTGKFRDYSPKGGSAFWGHDVICSLTLPDFTL